MPVIDLKCLSPNLTEDELDLVKRIIWAKRLRSNAPKIKFRREGYVRINDEKDLKAAYLWALCAYFISPYKIHGACLPDPRGIANTDRLKEIAYLICSRVPKELWYGLITRGER